MNGISLISAHVEHSHAGHHHGFVGEWLEHLIEQLPFSGKANECLSHIIVDTLNVFFILIVVMLAVFLLTSYIDLEKLHKKLGSLKSIWGFALAIVIGMLSPFCSCSIIPVLMGFLSMGVPVSVCLCYLTASSMINITALLSLYATTGPKFTLYYVIGSLFIIIVSSIIFSLFKLDNSISSYHAHHHDSFHKNQSFKERLSSAFSCTMDVLKRSALYIVFGVVLSSVLMTFFDIEYLSQLVNENSAISTAIVSFVGIPIHSDIFSIAPIITLLATLSPSVALTFTLATMAISLPSIIILSRAIKPKTVAVYCGVIIGLVLIVGYSLILIM
ncbi:permease [Paludicola sp. MB14-C6]|uniref:permease n=1 Tax=Paludihabitans sp. MB14-C6 TaxID=3070656 RepID=UPI0027DCA1F4|nr:permease [Paludicola sp. MB14-C6]WMJ22478.1 permease [Paludicola sp. MB14-C6]